MMRAFFLIFAFLVLLVLAAAGLRGCKSSRPPIEIFPDMVRQPKVKAQQPSEFYADGRAARPPVSGTIPLGYAMPLDKFTSGSKEALAFSGREDYFNTGRIGDQWGAGFPFTVTSETMQRGQERFGIYCAVCHGATGAGDGMAKQFGVVTIQSLLQDRIRTMPEGEVFHTITNGKNTMLGMGDRIPVPDRWAIIAYLRALQKSQGGATRAEVPDEELKKLEVPAHE